MKVQKKMSVDGDWAKVGEQINDGDRIKLLDAGQKVDGEWGMRDVFKIMTMQRGEYNLSFNQTSMNTMIDAWGDDTETWVGKVIKVFVVKQMIDKRLRNVAYLAPEDWTMDSEGKFINPKKAESQESKPEKKNEINPDDIPF